MKHLEMFGDSLLVEGTAGKRKIKGVAVHPMATHHPKEWAKVRIYLDDFLEKAAPSLVGKPLTLDHGDILEGCVVTSAWWNREMNRLEYEAEVTEDVAEKIQNGIIKNVSVGIDWTQPGGGMISTPEGFVPFGFNFEELALCQYLSPGDPMATVQLWEGMLKEALDTQSMKNPILLKGFQIMSVGGSLEDANRYLSQVVGLPEALRTEIRKEWFDWTSQQDAKKREEETNKKQEMPMSYELPPPSPIEKLRRLGK